MSRVHVVGFLFIDSAPAELRTGTLYISTKYRAIVHSCLCGCGEKVVLNLDPDSWTFTFDGRSISIWPSVGNIGLPCRSHYIVRRGQVKWLPPLTQIDPTRALEARPPSRLRNNLGAWLSRWRRD
jgi:hypothetical protein